MTLSSPPRRPSVSANVGGVLIGSRHPVVVQSMTNTDTANAEATALQVAQLARAGSELVRVTVNTREAAAALPEIVARLSEVGLSVPIVGDFHYNGHLLLREFPERPGCSPSTASIPATSEPVSTTTPISPP